MEINQHYRIKSFLEAADGIKLVCLGLVPGKQIQIVGRAPFRGAFLVECEQKRIAISSNELQQLNLERVDA